MRLGVVLPIRPLLHFNNHLASFLRLTETFFEIDLSFFKHLVLRSGTV